MHEDVYDAFLAAFTSKMSRFKVGTNFSDETDQGPQINKAQYDKILGYIDIGKREGATLHLGGKSINNGGGYFIEPTIFTDVTEDMKVRRSLPRHTRTFGLVLHSGNVEKADAKPTILADFERGDLWPRGGGCQVPV